MYETNQKKLHVWRIIIVALIVLLITAITIIIYRNQKYKDIPYYKENIRLATTYKDITSFDNSFTIKINNDYDIKKASLENYVLNLYTNDGFFMYVSSIKKYNFDLLKILESDKNLYIQKFEPYSNLTDITETAYTNLTGYSYSLNFTKQDKNCVLYEFVTVINNKIYFFDFEYPAENAQMYLKLINELLNSVSI